jgi:hypothetical protein
LNERARKSDSPNGNEFAQVKPQADPEEEKDHADFRELLSDGTIRDNTRREGSNGNAGEEVTDDWRDVKANRDVTEQESPG